MPDPHLPVPAPPGADWALVKPWVAGYVATLVLVTVGTRLDDLGHTLDEYGDPVAGDQRAGQIAEVEVSHWRGTRRASRRLLRMLDRQALIDAEFQQHRHDLEPT